MYELDESPDTLKEIKAIESRLLDNSKPLIFRQNSDENFVVESEKQFYRTLAILQEYGFSVDNSITVYEYRLKIEYIDEKIRLSKAKNKQN